MNSDTDCPGARHGRRFVATLVATLLTPLVVSVPPGAAQTRTVESQVAKGVATTATTEVPVIITLRTQVARLGRRGRVAEFMRDLKDTASSTQLRVLADLDGPARRYWLVNAIATDVDAAELAALRSNPEVASVELDQPVTVTGTATSDGTPTSWGIESVRAPLAWSAYGVTGAGVRIGSIDTGVDPTNPELAGAIGAWRDFVAGQPTPYDDNGHGTHTIGTMVARNVTGAGFGVAPGAQVVVAKAIGANGSASGSTLLAAAQWMTDPDGNPATADFPTVINNSWTSPGWDNEWFRPMVQAWSALGIVPVFGVGNTAGSVGSPASYPESIAVGAIDREGAPAANGSSGTLQWTIGGVPTTITKPDLSAPGVMIPSTVGAGYGYYSGSSMAAPHVAAAVALLRQARPELTVDAVREALRSGATDRGLPGADLQYGAGSLDIAASLAAVGAPTLAPSIAPAPQASPAPSASVTRPAKVRVLRVVRKGHRMIISGKVSGPARMRLVLRRVGKSQNSRITISTMARAKAGRFVLQTSAANLPRGRYVLAVSALDEQGTRLGSTTRSVRLR